MKERSEKQSSQNQGTRRADRPADQGGHRSQAAEKARQAHGTAAEKEKKGNR